MSIDALEDIEGSLAGRVGLRLDPTFRTRLHRGVREESAAAGLSLSGYSLAIERDPEMFQRLLNRVTIQHTWFFRDPDVFTAIATEVIPTLRDPIVAWSAGCSNGQEAYSLAMVLNESGRKDWTVLGTDVSTDALGRARSGVYTAAEVKSLSRERLSRHLTASSGQWEIRPKLKKRVRFGHHNLTSEAAPITIGSGSIVMCRNVLIYFNREDLVRVLGRVESAMRPDGYLFLGGSESLWQRSDRFQLTRVGSAFGYRLLAAPVAQERRRAATAVAKDMRRPSSIASLRGLAEAAAAAGDFAAAAANLRHATHIDPDQPVLHFQLALCLERAGQPEAARLALEASRSSIARCEEARVEAALEGFRPRELEQEIERRLRHKP